MGASAQAQSPAHPPAAPPLPAPRILVVDRQAILRFSKVGQDIVRQVNAYTQAAENEFKSQRDSLQKEQAAIQQQMAILAPDVREQKRKAFEAKVAAFQQKVQSRQSEIQGGVLQARQQVEQALAPVLQGIMQERQANLLLDRAAVVLGTIDIDVTKVAVQRLDQKLPSVKVQLVSLPASAQMGSR
jgi:Skp family chaperone for outer membrane proteins